MRWTRTALRISIWMGGEIAWRWPARTCTSSAPPFERTSAWAVSGATNTDIVAAAVRAQADEFIRQLPERYETAVGERGLRLSGGQRQRIAIARALVRNADLLILDEATNALDSLTEQALMRNVLELRRPQTIVIIAHRLSTVLEADLVIVMDQGRIVESGSPAELIPAGGPFSVLYKAQTTSLKTPVQNS